MTPPDPVPLPLVLFDGPCTLCNRSVRFIIRHEKQPSLTFASLQSEVGRKMITDHNLPETIDAMVLIESEKVLYGSDAAIELCSYLPPPWRFARVFRFLPKKCHRAIYRWIARNRYRWFGKDDACPLPDPGQAHRFLR
jgi:predicted DCC family thiol-disulfide oxidoreductase YuxK